MYHVVPRNMTKELCNVIESQTKYIMYLIDIAIRIDRSKREVITGLRYTLYLGVYTK